MTKILYVVCGLLSTTTTFAVHVETNAKVVELSNIAASTQLDVNNFNASSFAASKMSDVALTQHLQKLNMSANDLLKYEILPFSSLELEFFSFRATKFYHSRLLEFEFFRV